MKQIPLMFYKTRYFETYRISFLPKHIQLDQTKFQLLHTTTVPNIPQQEYFIFQLTAADTDRLAQQYSYLQLEFQFKFDSIYLFVFLNKKDKVAHQQVELVNLALKEQRKTISQISIVRIKFRIPIHLKFNHQETLFCLISNKKSKFTLFNEKEIYQLKKRKIHSFIDCFTCLHLFTYFKQSKEDSPRQNYRRNGYETNENSYGQNYFNYDELNTSLNHQDQAKVNRAINMGWIPQKQVDHFRSDKTKQQLYREELQKQIDEKQELKMQQLQKQKIEEEKLDRKIMKQLNIPRLDLNSVQAVSKHIYNQDQNTYLKSPSKLVRTPPQNFLRKNSNSYKNIPKYNEQQQQYLQFQNQKNRSSLNNLQMPISPHSNLKKIQNPNISPRQVTKIPVIFYPSQNSVPTSRPSFLSSGREAESTTQIGLEMIKRQMQESYLNASKQLDELKMEMERIREQKNQAQQEFFELRSQIKNQIQYHNLKLYGGVNYAKNPSKYYQQQFNDNHFANNDSSIIYQFISESTLDQNLLQYSQTISSKTLKQSFVQTPQIIQSQRLDNQQQVNLSTLKSKDLLDSKQNTQQDLEKIEQNLNESQISRISHQSKKQSEQNLQQILDISKDQQKEQKSLNNSQVQAQQQPIEIVQKGRDISQTVKRINSPVFDIKQQETQLDISKELSGQNFFFTEVKQEPIKEAENKDENFKKQQIEDNIQSNSKRQATQNQNEDDFKKLIKNIEDMVEEQTQDIQNVSNQHKIEAQNNITFKKSK